MLYYDDHSSGVDQIRQSQRRSDERSGRVRDDSAAGPEFISCRRTANPGTPFILIRNRLNSDPDRAEARSAELHHRRSISRCRLSGHLLPGCDRGGQCDADSDPRRRTSAGGYPPQSGSVPALCFFVCRTTASNGFLVPQLEQPAFDGYDHLSDRCDAAGFRRDWWKSQAFPRAATTSVLSEQARSLQMNGVDLTKDGEEVDLSRSDAFSSVKVSVQIARRTHTSTAPLGWFALGRQNDCVLLQVSMPKEKRNSTRSGRPL